MSNIKSIKERMDRNQAVSVLEEMKAGLIHNTHAAITKAAALEMAIEFLKGNWKDVSKEKPEQFIHVIIWDDDIRAIGEGYWDGEKFHWVCDDMVANAALWKEYQLPLTDNGGK